MSSTPAVGLARVTVGGETSNRSARWLRIAPLAALGGPVLLSIGVWLLVPPSPDGVTGYISRAGIDPVTVLFVCCWLGAVGLISTASWTAGLARGAVPTLARGGEQAIQRLSFALGCVGTGWVYWSVTGGSPSAILSLWRSHQFSEFQYRFQYGVGLATLRYAAVIAGALAIAHFLRGRRLDSLDVGSIVLLGATVLAVSRISALMALLGAVGYLAVHERPRIHLWRGVLLLVVGAGIFTAATVSRSTDYYRSYGHTSAIGNSLLNAQGYVATPSQVTMQGVTAALEGRTLPSDDLDGIVGAAIPPYLANVFGAHYKGPAVVNSVEGRYQGSVDVSLSLTTNGVLVDTLYEYGWFGLFGVLLSIIPIMWIAGRFARSGPVGGVFAGVALYSLAEVWRVDLFNAGSIHFILLLGLSAGVWKKLAGAAGRPLGPARGAR